MSDKKTKQQLEIKRSELKGIRKRADEIESEISNMEDVFLYEVGLGIAKSNILGLLKWNIEYMYTYEETTVRFRSEVVSQEFNEVMKGLLRDHTRLVAWQPISVGSFKLFYSTDTVTLVFNVQKWHELPTLLAEVREYGVEHVDVTEVMHSLKCNKMRVAQQSTLLVECADTFTTTLNNEESEEES